MKKIFSVLNQAGVALSLVLAAGAANAALINAGVSFSDGLGTLSATPGRAVSDLTVFDFLDDIAFQSGEFGDIANAADNTADAFDLDLGSIDAVNGTLLFSTDDDFNWYVTGYTPISAQVLPCGDGICTDLITFALQGFVTSPGYDDTPFAGSFTAQGTITAGGKTGSWSASLASVVPVPAALPLLASGLVGLGVIARRRKARAA